MNTTQILYPYRSESTVITASPENVSVPALIPGRSYSSQHITTGDYSGHCKKILTDLLHCALSIAAQCIVIGPVCGGRTDGRRAGGRAGWGVC